MLLIMMIILIMILLLVLIMTKNTLIDVNKIFFDLNFLIS